MNAGAIWKGFSVDAIYTKEWGTVVSTSIPNPAYTTGVSCLPLACPYGLLGVISDNEAWSVMGKYAYEFEGGLKDEEPPSKLTAFAGYVHIDMGNPRDTNIPPGSTTIGGYELVGVTTTPIPGTFCKPSGQAEISTAFWLEFHGAYYRYTQDEYINSKGKNCLNAAKALVGNPTPSNCAGALNQGSFLIDYAFNKHWDAYAGVSYMENGGGLNSAYLNDIWRHS